MAVVLFGVGIELLQGRMHFGREADPADLVANVVGMAMGFVLAFKPLAQWAERAEALVIRRSGT